MEQTQPPPPPKKKNILLKNNGTTPLPPHKKNYQKLTNLFNKLRQRQIREIPPPHKKNFTIYNFDLKTKKRSNGVTLCLLFSFKLLLNS